MRVNAKPLRGVVGSANHLASGDLTHTIPITGTGRIAQLQMALAQLVVSTRSVISDVEHEVGNLRGGTLKIANMANNTQLQSGGLEETVAALEQINDTVQQTANMAQEGVGSARDIAAVAQRSHAAVQNMGDTMREINEASRRIGDIMSVIEGVAFQTNILALNAAVEAARAGEQGKGFAVVASEVRALAQRTTQAAKEIKQLIVDSDKRVALGSQRAGEANARMGEMMESIAHITASLEQINAAASEQSASLGHINTAITQIDNITQQNTAMVEELASAASSLDDQVTTVHNAIRVFHLDGGGASLAEADAVELRKQNLQNKRLIGYASGS
jgi:aerotaxis receptor